MRRARRSRIRPERGTRRRVWARWLLRQAFTEGLRYGNGKQPPPQLPHGEYGRRRVDGWREGNRRLAIPALDPFVDDPECPMNPDEPR